MEEVEEDAANAKAAFIILIGRAFSVVLVMAFLLTLLLSKLHGFHFVFSPIQSLLFLDSST